MDKDRVGERTLTYKAEKDEESATTEEEARKSGGFEYLKIGEKGLREEKEKS